VFPAPSGKYWVADVFATVLGGVVGGVTGVVTGELPPPPPHAASGTNKAKPAHVRARRAEIEILITRVHPY
jgi:hypothetical protein